MAVNDSDTLAAERSAAFDIVCHITSHSLPLCKIESSSTITTGQLLNAISVMEGLLALSKFAGFFAPEDLDVPDLMEHIRDGDIIPALTISQEMIANRLAHSLKDFVKKYEEAVDQMCYALDTIDRNLERRLQRLIKCREDPCQYCAEMKVARLNAAASAVL